MAGIPGPAVATLVPTHLPPSVEVVFPDGTKRVVQVNFCKNPLCANYGVPATAKRMAKRGRASSVTMGDDIAKTYADAEGRDDVESFEMPTLEENPGDTDGAGDTRCGYRRDSGLGPPSRNKATRKRSTFYATLSGVARLTKNTRKRSSL